VSAEQRSDLIYDPRLPLPVVSDEAQVGWTRREIMDLAAEAGEGDSILRRVGLSVEDEAGRPLMWEGMNLNELLETGEQALDLYAQTCSRHKGEVKVVEHQFALARRWPFDHGRYMHPLLHDLEGGMALVAAVKVVKHAHHIRARGAQEIAEGLQKYRRLDPAVSIRDMSADHFLQKDYGRRKYLVDIDLPLVIH
jgi:hypothetical protein